MSKVTGANIFLDRNNNTSTTKAGIQTANNFNPKIKKLSPKVNDSHKNIQEYLLQKSQEDIPDDYNSTFSANEKLAGPPPDLKRNRSMFPKEIS